MDSSPCDCTASLDRSQVAMRTSATLLFTLAILGVAPPNDAVAQTPSPTVFRVPKYSAPRVTIQPPAGRGWRILDERDDAVTFAYYDARSEADFLAVASHFEPQSANTESAFMAEFRRYHDASLKELYRVVSVQYRTSHETGNLCIRSFVEGDVRRAKEDPAVRVFERTIACRKSSLTTHGLFAYFRYVSPTSTPELEAAVESLFAGVQFTQ